ncbi:MAG: ATP-binding protein [Acidobacteriota bacterium]
MARFFNTEGPVDARKHYCLPALSRLDLPDVLSLIEREKYFVLHAPRQTGKTTCMLALMEYLNREGRYRCLYANFEVAQSAREDVRRGIRAILGEIGSRARHTLGDPIPLDAMGPLLDQYGEDAALNALLTQWAETGPRPLVLLVDEIDSLVGDTLIAVLRQLRAGYDKRPRLFPQSVVLCGVRDVKEYRIHSDREKAVITGGSAFNIKAKSLRLGDFSQEEMTALYRQHAEETGQVFEGEAIEVAWELTRGQPWLVNALAYEACFEMPGTQDRSSPITGATIEEAKERLILYRVTHLDQLADKLREDRVRRVVEPMLRGGDFDRPPTADDLEYAIDLGLVRRGPAGPEISNPIYREVIPRELTQIVQSNIESIVTPLWYVTADGRLDMMKLMAGFQDFFRENSEAWLERFDYKEAGPQLLLQAFLQRVVNSSGRIGREYGLGRGRADLLVMWRHPGGVQKAVVELKILRKSLKRTIAEGVRQTAEYMDRCGVSIDGHLVIFDRDPAKSWDAKVFQRTETFEGKTIQVWGM